MDLCNDQGTGNNNYKVMCPNQCPYTSSVQGVSKLVCMPCTNWALAWALAWAHVYISKQLPSLGTPTSTAVVVPDPGVHDCNKASY